MMCAAFVVGNELCLSQLLVGVCVRGGGRGCWEICQTEEAIGTLNGMVYITLWLILSDCSG